MKRPLSHTIRAALCGASLLLITPSLTVAQESEEEAPTAATESPLQRARAAYDRGDWQAASKLYGEVYDSKSASSTARVEAALERSSILWEQGSYTSAKKLAEEAFELAEAQRIDGAVGRLLVTIGHIETSQGKFSSARKTFKICTRLSEEGDDAVFAAICRMNIAMLDRLQGKGGGKGEQFEKDIEALKGAKTPLATGSALAKTAEMFAETGDPARAYEMLEQAQAQFSAAGSVPAMARNRIRLARVLQLMGDYDRARAHLKLGKEAFSKMNNRPAMIDVYGLLGKDAEVAGRRDEAIGYYQKALEGAEAISNPQLEARSHLALCEVMVSPPTKGVTHHCESAKKGFSKLGIKVLEVRAQIALASLSQQNGELKQARELYIEAIASMEALPSSQQSAESLATQKANLCQVNQSLQATGALKSCEDALDALTKLDDAASYQAHIASTYYNAGFSAQREERYKKALQNFEHAAAAFMKTSPADPLRSADAHMRMGIIYSVLLEGEENAVQAFERGLEVLGKGSGGDVEKAMKAKLYQQLVQELVEQKRWKEAIARGGELVASEELATFHQELAYTHNNLAMAYLKDGQREQAKSALSAGIREAKAAGNEKELLSLMQKNLKALK